MLTARRAVATLGAVVVGLTTMGASSCSTSSGTPAGSTTPSATAQNVALGAAVHVTDSSGGSAFVTVESVKFATAGSGPIAQPPKNGTFAIADVLIQDDAGAYNFNPLYVKYQEPDGTTSDAFSGNAITAGFDPTLSAGTLSPGQKTRGNVVFDVKVKGGLIQVTDPLGSVVGQWTVPAT